MRGKCGIVYWITGLAGSGKTTIGEALYNKLKTVKSNVVFLDGDILRNIFGNCLGYSSEDRKKLAMCYSRLCKILSDQGIDVICATISLFKDVHKFNKKNIKKYYEFFIECNMQELIKRDKNNIYSKAIKGKINHVVGIDIPYEKPERCDVVIDNTVKSCLNEKVCRIIQFVKKHKK